MDIVENPKKENIFKKKKEDFLDSKKKHSRKIANAKHYKKKSMAKSRIVKTQKLSLQDSSAQDNTNYAQRSGSTLVSFTRGTFLDIGAIVRTLLNCSLSCLKFLDIGCGLGEGMSFSATRLIQTTLE